MYMSYCRQEGTLNELRACLCDAADHFYEEAEYPVSKHEVKNFKEMIEYFYEWIVHMGLLDANGELDTDELEVICEAMRKGYGEEEN